MGDPLIRSGRILSVFVTPHAFPFPDTIPDPDPFAHVLSLYRASGAL